MRRWCDVFSWVTFSIVMIIFIAHVLFVTYFKPGFDEFAKKALEKEKNRVEKIRK